VSLECLRVGFGVDQHALVEGRALILGGVHIPFFKGLLGHSDGDVLVHAIMDALLSAAGLKDIGTLFPGSDPAYKNVKSLNLLSNVKDFLDKERVGIINIDGSMLVQKPIICPFIDDMRSNIAAILDILPKNVIIKAKSPEGIGSMGRCEGIEAFAAVLTYFKQ